MIPWLSAAPGLVYSMLVSPSFKAQYAAVKVLRGQREQSHVTCDVEVIPVAGHNIIRRFIGHRAEVLLVALGFVLIIPPVNRRLGERPSRVLFRTDRLNVLFEFPVAERHCADGSSCAKRRSAELHPSRPILSIDLRVV